MARGETEHVRALYRAIYAVIRKIPRGRVATYGQVAELAGIPGGARVAAAALKVSTRADRLPWQRVIGKAGPTRGRIAIHDPVGAAIQRHLLEEEGVEVDERGHVRLDAHAWLNRQDAKIAKGRGPRFARTLRTTARPRADRRARRRSRPK
jgi:methylated-DNA-protein-cysteine methyltransferase-like protein